MVADWILAVSAAVVAGTQVYSAYDLYRIRQLSKQPPAPSVLPFKRVRAALHESSNLGETQPNAPVLTPRASMASLRAGLAATMTEEQAREKRVAEYHA